MSALEYVDSVCNHLVMSPASQRHSVTRRVHNTTRASRHDLETLRLKIAKVPVADIEKAISMMRPDVAKRFSHVFYDLVCKPAVALDARIPASNLPRRFAQQLVDNSICEIVSAASLAAKPTRSAGIPFLVKESKLDPATNEITERLRFIFWTKALNEWLHTDGYKADVDLRHIATYLDAVTLECATTGDISSGFYHIPIPSESRDLYRFQDSDGNVYQMARLPMGLSTSVELMQRLTETLIGSPNTCSPEFVIRGVRTHDAWVDDFRLAGDDVAVRNAAATIAQRADLLRIALKTKPQANFRYEFLGLAWNHELHMIGLGKKMLAKLPSLELSASTSSTSSRQQQQQHQQQQQQQRQRPALASAVDPTSSSSTTSSARHQPHNEQSFVQHDYPSRSTASSAPVPDVQEHAAAEVQDENPIPVRMTARQLESLVARLIYAAGALRIPLARFYLSLKWTTRRFNHMNRGLLRPDDEVVLTPTVRRELHEWLRLARTTKLIPGKYDPNPRYHVMFSDASLFGWGAVLIDSFQQVFIAGAQWPEHLRNKTSSDIGQLEAAALSFGIDAFKWRLLESRNVEIRVDNTSVESAVRRGTARASAICDQLKDNFVWLADESFAITVAYVRSEDNPADPISRGRAAQHLTREQVTRMYSRRGGGGRTWRVVNEPV